MSDFDEQGKVLKLSEGDKNMETLEAESFWSAMSKVSPTTILALVIALISFMGWITTAQTWGKSVEMRITALEQSSAETAEKFEKIDNRLERMRLENKSDFSKLGDKIDRLRD